MTEKREPLVRVSDEQSSSPTPSPNDHVRTLVEMLRPGGADLARRWVAALFLAPETEREEIVASVERRLVGLYAKEDAEAGEREGGDSPQVLHLAEPPIQREGYVEQTIRTYERAEDEQEAPEAPIVETREQQGQSEASAG